MIVPGAVGADRSHTEVVTAIHNEESTGPRREITYAR